MDNNIDYLLKYIDSDTYDRILNYKGGYLIDLIIDNKRDVCLNIDFLIKYGVKNINHVVYERLEELVINHEKFILFIEEYEKTLDRESIISILENV